MRLLRHPPGCLVPAGARLGGPLFAPSPALTLEPFGFSSPPRPAGGLMRDKRAISACGGASTNLRQRRKLVERRGFTVYFVCAARAISYTIIH